MLDPLKPVDERGLGIKGWLRGPKQKAPRTNQTAGVVNAGRERIAILPFANISPDPQDEYFADGMTEELISTLSKIGTLKVISRTSVMRYKHTDKSVEEISRELNVGSILEGSVRKAANDLRITVKLIDVRKDEHVWSQDYERRMENVFAVQKEIARRVVESLPVDLLPIDRRNIEKQGTRSLEAYELYLKGRFLWNKRSKDSMTESIQCFQSAIQKDPSYPLPYVGLADAYSLLVINRHIPPGEGYPKAEQALAKALKLDETLGEAHASLGLIRSDADWNWTAAEHEYKRAIEFNPNYATAHHWYSILLGPTTGRMEEALAEAKKALDLDPLSPIINLNLAWGYLGTGNLDLVEEAANKALSLEPNFGGALEVLSYLAVERGRFQEAIDLQKKIDSIYPPRQLKTRVTTAYILAKSGDIEKAKQVFEDSHTRPGEGYVTYVDHAAYYAAIGETDRAFEMLNHAVENHEQELCTLIGFPELRNISSDPRFTGILAKMKLPIRKA